MLAIDVFLHTDVYTLLSCTEKRTNLEKESRLVWICKMYAKCANKTQILLVQPLYEKFEILTREFLPEHINILYRIQIN